MGALEEDAFTGIISDHRNILSCVRHVLTALTEVLFQCSCLIPVPSSIHIRLSENRVQRSILSDHVRKSHWQKIGQKWREETKQRLAGLAGWSGDQGRRSEVCLGIREAQGLFWCKSRKSSTVPQLSRKRHLYRYYKNGIHVRSPEECWYTLYVSGRKRA